MRDPKPLIFVGSSRDDLRAMPEKVRRDLGFALRLVQRGEFPEIAKPLQGKAFKGVYELRVRDQGNAYRAAYIANLGDHIYVLHAFQKKSSQGDP